MNKDKTPSAFQRWVQEQLRRRSWNPGDLHRALVSAGENLTEGYVYRVAQGGTGPTRPGYDIVFAIGQALGDPRSALELAGYKVPRQETRMDEGMKRWLEIYATRDESTRQQLLSAVEGLLAMKG